ncbi:MAG: histidine kinase [Gammaproteobacteria bacterium]
MNDHAKTEAQLVQEIGSLRHQVAHLEALSEQYRRAERKLAWLATIPEQNPNIVVETDATGRVTYLNLAAQARFPDLFQDGFAHPLLKDIPAMLSTFESGNQSYISREIELGEGAFEQKIFRYTKEPGVVRIRVYAHDVTRRKRAEEAIQKLAQRLVYAQEEERQRLSRELHDEAGQALTALKLGLELLQRELPVDPAVLRQNLAEAIALSESTKERVRLLALGLRPPGLDTVGLNLTLEAFCRDFSRRTQLLIEYHGTEVRGFSDAMNICLYRVLQEALTNVVKHAQATQVNVNLALATKTLRLIVADNGRGFDQTSAKPLFERPSGIGLLGMRERLELLGGWLDLEFAPSCGLRLVANLPVNGSA